LERYILIYSGETWITKEMRAEHGSRNETDQKIRLHLFGLKRYLNAMKELNVIKDFTEICRPYRRNCVLQMPRSTTALHCTAPNQAGEDLSGDAPNPITCGNSPRAVDYTHTYCDIVLKSLQ
jgi:hypothetical protein